MKLLLIEDDRMIGESLTHALKTSGYTVDWARDGEVGEESLHTGKYKLVLLDLGLPKRSGMEILQQLRNRKDKVPVLILSARDQIKDRVQALDLGADDYLVKPFALEELEARIRGLLRRTVGNADTVLQAGDAILNTVTREIEYDGKTLLLSAKEYALMHMLMEKPGKVTSRPELEELLYGWNEEVNSNAVEVLIHALRKKLGSTLIQNIRGMGYLVAKTRTETTP